MNVISAGDFYKQVAEDTGLTQTMVKQVLTASGERMKANLKAGNEMHFMGYFNVCVKAKPAQNKINPLTKEKMKVPACKVPAIKLSASFKQLLKKKK